MPIPWNILPHAEFGRYRVPEAAAADDDALTARLLVQVGPSGRLENHFRIAIGGRGQVRAKFPAAMVINSPALAALTLAFELDAQEISPLQNGFSTKWEDLGDLVASGRIHAFTATGGDAEADFRRLYESARKAEEPTATALRWSVQANEAYGFELCLQALPATARALRRDARLSSDETRAIHIAVWPAITPLDDTIWIGPVPTLFTKDAAQTASNLQEHPDRFLSGTGNE